MTLASGTKLGSYEITGSLGAGGMGEVCRARDTRLGRSVAIKVLPEAFAADPDRVPRFERGPLPAADALAIAIQIADALESAHEQGVVHRDLKPANVKIIPDDTPDDTPDDKVKVLDFGLAKAMDSAPAASSPANSPTLSVLAT